MRVKLKLYILLLSLDMIKAKEICNNETCKLPDCLCMSPFPPFGYMPEEVPHLVFLAFDYAPARGVDEFYSRLVGKRTNPNGCPISLTFFTSHQVNARLDNATSITTYADYQFINNLFSDGHELGSRFIKYEREGYLRMDALKSVQHSRELLNHHANVPTETVKLVHVDGISDDTLRSLKSFGYFYDTSISSKTGLLVWPYTLDYGVTHQACAKGPCPSNNYPGIWEVPLMKLPGLWRNGCQDSESHCRKRNATETFKYYKLVFELHVNNSVPFGLFQSMHQLIANPSGIDGYLLFLDFLAERKNVYIVSITQGIEWIRHPAKLKDLTMNGNHSLDCPTEAHRKKNSSCKTLRNCVYVDETYGQREFITCNACPYRFPEAGSNLSKSIMCSGNDHIMSLLLTAVMLKHYLG